MNQILFTGNSFSNNKKKIKKLKIQFFVSLFIILCIFLYLLYVSHIRNEKEKFSDTLLDTFNIERLYYNGNSSTSIIPKENSVPSIIGSIEIPKINIHYPIISNTTDEFLKLSPCRFYGPFPNEIGNLCIAGHNYNNNKFFSNIYSLEENDIINIYDINNFCVTYYVYNKFEISSTDTSVVSQNTNNKREITLITCNNVNNNRFIIKAKE